MLRKRITDILFFLSIGVLLFGSGYKLGQYETSSSPQNRSYTILNTVRTGSAAQLKNLNFGLFWQVWDDLQQKYVEKSNLDPQKMLYSAIKGLVASAHDPYTFFLTPDENQTSKNDLAGKFEGIGAELGMTDNRIVIVAPLKNSPAEKVGVRSGDYIDAVDGQSTKGWSLNQAVTKIRGKQGTNVKLTLDRDNKTFDVVITREQINVPSVELSYEQNIAYLKLNEFGDNTFDEWDKAVEEIAGKWEAHQIQGMVLDLRDNPGGFLDGAVYLASDFLPQGKLIVKQESTTPSESKDYYVTRQGRLLNIPLIVLVNKGSASAAEILSGALQDYKRAKLIGEKTFGKGSVQEALDLNGGSGLHVTVAKWILPNGEWINGKGIQPDITVTNQIKAGNTLTRQDDKQLDAAIQQVLSSK